MRGAFYKTQDSRIGVQLHRFECLEITDPQLKDIIHFQSGLARFRKGSRKITTKIKPPRASQKVDNLLPGQGVPRLAASDVIGVDSNPDDKIKRLFYKFLDHYIVTPNNNYYGIETTTAVIFPPMASNIYVYSDVVAETYVGDRFVPLLRTVPIHKENQGKYVTEFFDNPRYLPLSRNYIEQIEIRLCDSYGENIRFLWGTVVVTLRYRRHKSPD